MSDIFTNDGYYQGSAFPTRLVDYLFRRNVYQGTSHACIVDLVPPVFAGVASLVVQSRGQIRAAWLAGSDISLPIRYEVYIQPSTATGLFNSVNMVALTDKLQYDIWSLPNGSLLANGTTYYVGVRAIDGVGNRDSNTVVLSVVSTGVVAIADVYTVEGAFSINTSNQFQGTMWILKNSVLGSGPSLGTARYEIYDRAGALVSGMSESGIVADSNGQFKITPITSTLNKTLDHYLVKVMIVMDGVQRTGYVALIEKVPEYEIHGTFTFNTSNQLIGSFWASADDEAISNLARLGSASYQVYDSTGASIPGMSGSGFTADANGLYHITPIASTLSRQLTFYSVKVTIIVDNIARTDFLSIVGEIPSYDATSQIGIDGSGMLQGTFWISSDDKIKIGATLGTATYGVYDNSGNLVPGLTQSGLVANPDGRFVITPVSAAALTDPTHYVVNISVTVDGLSHVFYKPLASFSAMTYAIESQIALDDSDVLQGSFLIAADGVIKTGASLGTASYEVRDRSGTPVVGLSQSGIVADVNGRFVITPVSATQLVDLTHYEVKIVVTVDAVVHTYFVPIFGKILTYEVKAQFSINALNQFQATIWAIADGKIKTGASLGTCTYTVYDAAGTAVAGLTESGIVADVNGRFHITPVSAILLTDLTHYSVRLGVVVDGLERVSYRGFTLLGT